MAQRVGLLNGTNITYDKDLTAGLLAILNQWVIEGLGITGTWASAEVLPWKALIECIRTNGEKVMVFFENTANVAVDLTGTKKVYILVDQGKLDDGSSNAEDGTGIASIQTSASYPSWNYLPLASISGGVITDEREFITGKPVMRKELSTNKALITNASGDEVAIDMSEWQVLGKEWGVMKWISPSVNITGLSETTTLSNSDEFIVNSSGNKKVTFDTIRKWVLPTIPWSSVTSFGYSWSSVWTTASVAIPKGGIATLTLSASSSGSYVTAIQYSSNNSTWVDAWSFDLPNPSLSFARSMTILLPAGYVRGHVTNGGSNFYRSLTVQAFN